MTSVCVCRRIVIPFAWASPLWALNPSSRPWNHVPTGTRAYADLSLPCLAGEEHRKLHQGDKNKKKQQVCNCFANKLVPFSLISSSSSSHWWRILIRLAMTKQFISLVQKKKTHILHASKSWFEFDSITPSLENANQRRTLTLFRLISPLLSAPIKLTTEA